MLQHPAQAKELYCRVRLELIPRLQYTHLTTSTGSKCLGRDITNCCTVGEMSHQICCSNLKQILCCSIYSKMTVHHPCPQSESISRQDPFLYFLENCCQGNHPDLLQVNERREQAFSSTARQKPSPVSATLQTHSASSLPTRPHLWHCQHQCGRRPAALPCENTERTHFAKRND